MSGLPFFFRVCLYVEVNVAREDDGDDRGYRGDCGQNRDNGGKDEICAEKQIGLCDHIGLVDLSYTTFLILLLNIIIF